ncbi:hypothetical protein [Pseudomonas phage vB_PaeM_FBPa14]|uniref:Uncharacterized protein n=1 Tax=Pseudomonas phage vB_PaeM_FBPa14 TaxID=2945962 RepID=A0A9E7MMG3_9CAUD|nr:hypothetical protein [Pseudomonas phage vB_PaeM_FBPa14]USL88939.1 hypothetical protein [Pseudomonas phage vB_PaeM_FBPa24]UVN13303.1 hypothetical protein FBPa12_0008 [Pseudomonas phage vB_PaeM_FBPa12]UVN13610.1 hypothetical protein FBPa24_0011 [Pseudomonas phage vB_PaeM_FBPa24]
MYNKPTLNHHHQTALLYLYNNPDQPAFTGPNNQALNELRQMGYVKAKKFENWAGTGHLRMEWTLTKAGIERVEVGFLGKCAACKGIGQTLLRGKCTVCNGRGQGWISEWSQKPIEDNPQIVPKFEKTDANRLADAIEEIARLEKALAESEKRGSELAASYCDGVVGDEYGHPYCRYKVERDAALAEVERLRESKGDPSGSFDRCMKMMYERDENAKQLEVALARVAELEKELAMARDAAAKGDAARHAAGGMEMEIHELKTKLAELEKQEPVAWGAFHFGGKRDGKLYTQCETEAQIEAYILDMHRSSDSLTLRKGPLYTAPVAQAQHSVPDGWKLVPMDPTSQMTLVGQSLRSDSVNSIGEIYRQMLAVAPSPIDPAAHPQPCQQPQAHPARCGCER